jgi:hypothetical protein
MYFPTCLSQKGPTPLCHFLTSFFHYTKKKKKERKKERKKKALPKQEAAKRNLSVQRKINRRTQYPKIDLGTKKRKGGEDKRQKAQTRTRKAAVKAA